MILNLTGDNNSCYSKNTVATQRPIIMVATSSGNDCNYEIVFEILIIKIMINISMAMFWL